MGACGTTHVLLPAGDSNRVALCEGSECTPAECCQPKGQCSTEVCNTDSYLMEDYPSLCEGATCTNEECCATCPFAGTWRSTSVFGGDALVVTDESDCDSGWEVYIASMRAVRFCFIIERDPASVAECQCRIMLDTLTIAGGEMSETRDDIAWDTILNNDAWEREAAAEDRRLDAPRNYEIKDGSIIIFPQERRLQQQDIRMDFDIQTATENDAVILQGRFQEMELWEVEEVLKSAISSTNFTIGSVYMMSDAETQTVVTPGQRTSGAVRSADFWTWMPVSAIVAALFLV